MHTIPWSVPTLWCYPQQVPIYSLHLSPARMLRQEFHPLKAATACNLSPPLASGLAQTGVAPVNRNLTVHPVRTKPVLDMAVIKARSGPADSAAVAGVTDPTATAGAGPRGSPLSSLQVLKVEQVHDVMYPLPQLLPQNLNQHRSQYRVRPTITRNKSPQAGIVPDRTQKCLASATQSQATGAVSVPCTGIVSGEVTTSQPSHGQLLPLSCTLKHPQPANFSATEQKLPRLSVADRHKDGSTVEDCALQGVHKSSTSTHNTDCQPRRAWHPMAGCLTDRQGAADLTHEVLLPAVKCERPTQSARACTKSDLKFPGPVPLYGSGLTEGGTDSDGDSHCPGFWIGMGPQQKQVRVFRNRTGGLVLSLSLTASLHSVQRLNLPADCQRGYIGHA